MSRAFEQVREWPVENAAVAAVTRERELGGHGDSERPFAWASVTKLLTGMAALVALEKGIVELDEPAGPPGSTFRHLLAHASGLPTDGTDPIAEPGRRRIYSNTGIDVAAERIAAASDMPFAAYLRAAVLEPLGVAGRLRGTPAAGYEGPLTDLLAVARELLAPKLVASETLGEATSVQFPGLAGVLPGFGRHDPNDWGLTFELRDAKEPHWTATRNSPRTFGHFGATGTFVWIDPEAGVALACLTDCDFGDWAKTAWPALGDAVLELAVVGE